jgi:hypothetical protein
LGSLKEAVFSALAAVIQQHPILSAVPNDQESHFPRFVRLPTIDLRKVVESVFRKLPYDGNGRDQELDEFLEDRLNVPFNTESNPLPFWRVLVLIGQSSQPEFIVTFIYHHGIADGMSGVIFHDSFLSALNAKRPGLEGQIIVSPRMPLLPNLEIVHDLDEDPNRRPDFDRSGLWSGDVMQSPVVGRFRSSVFRESTTDQLVQACRTKGTTVTATIQVILAISLFRSLPTSFARLRSVTPINVRHLLRAPIDCSSMGVYIDLVKDSYHREELRSFSWSEARGAREIIVAHLEEADKLLNSAHLKHIQGINQAMVDCLGQKRDHSFEVSNLGVFGARMQDAANENNWKSGRMVFSRSAAALAPALGCAIITGADGCLVLGYNWQVGIVDDELVAEVIRNVEDEIFELTK